MSVRLEMLTPADIAATLVKSPDWHAERATGLGGSDAAKIMSGEWQDLWRQKMGETPDDLADMFEVNLGTWTEAFNLYWFAKITRMDVIRVPQTVWRAAAVHGEAPMYAHLDAYCASGPVECKHYNAFIKPDAALARVYWQAQHILACTGDEQCAVSIIYGNAYKGPLWIARNPEDIDRLVQRAAEFWGYVRRREAPPGSHADVVEIDRGVPLKTASMTGRNEWAQHAADWLANAAAAKTFETAAEALKKMVDDDVGLAAGHGVRIKRDARGALRISKE